MLLNRTYFDTYQEQIQVVVNPSSKIPNTNIQPYSDISKMVGQLNFTEPVIIKPEEQILKYTNNNGFEFVFKRFAIYYTVEEEKSGDLLKVPRIIKLLNNGLKEYYISKIVAAHPAGIIAFDFRITKLVNLKCLVTEFLMEDAGLQLTNYFNNGTITNLDCVKIFRQISNVMRYIETLQIVYNDVKLGNFLIDGKGNIRIIDYDVSQASSAASSKTLFGVQQILGYSPGFVSPEALKLYDKVKKGEQKKEDQINPWKADIYLCGILGLCLTGAITSNEMLNSLDINKGNPDNHKKVMDLICKVKCHDNITTNKMKKILESCLQFEPSKRMTFKFLNELMTSFTHFSEAEVASFIGTATISKEAPRDQLYKRIEYLESSLKKSNEEILQLKLKTKEIESQNKEELRNAIVLKDKEMQEFHKNYQDLQNIIHNHLKEREQILNLIYGKIDLNIKNINLFDCVEK